MAESSELALLETHARRAASGRPADAAEVLALLRRIDTHGAWPRFMLRILCDTAPNLRDSADARRQFFHAARAFVALQQFAD